MNWISVEIGSLPENGQEVLVVRRFDCGSDGIYSIVQFFMDEDTQEYFWESCETGDVIGSGPTHWCALTLPQPPE